ncbi:Threonine/homoserine efflux transporter RhtA [Loktanella sp. DSM 29012]|uniref:DMT family transporter n=1 Tax=Loktanella sp. DSM 29012 TaxID=1881056 RepID=UPI0008AFECF5|nr:DMT family transporter [Loktanella sp. DSM 29012]SEQ00850.1 Threonine/homoserine efflux transporter RhtA [Loktanella sp. DSM 29012]
MSGQIARATFIVVLSGAIWGFYWLPVRMLSDAGLGGAWGTLAITVSALLVLAPATWRARSDLRRASPLALVSIGLGGLAFALYSIGFNYGRVAIIILLFFLTPVWSVLITRFVLGWHTPMLRIVAIGLGLGGLCVMLSADGQWPVPRGIGEWMALAAGILWSLATTGMRTASQIAPAPAAFVFALGAVIASVLMAPSLSPWQTAPVPGVTIIVALGTGALWWGLSTACLMWATVRLDPARVGILLMAEVLIGAASAALLAGEALAPLELAGGALVLFAGVCEVWPVRQRV